MVDVNTHMPSTGVEIELVTADEWANMSVTELFDQRIILNNRYATASQFGNPNMLRAMQTGVQHLDAIINHKEKQKLKNIDKRQKDITGLI